MSEAEPEHPTWLMHLKAGEEQGLNELWKRFFDRLVDHAKGRIKRTGHPTMDEEAVACSVFESIWRAASDGRLASVESCDELWWWLLSAARRKVVNHLRHETAQKRGGEVAFVPLGCEQGVRDLLSSEPDPAYLAMLSEEYEKYLSALNDEQLQRIAVMRLSGATNDEICDQLSIAPATVTRKIRLIYEIWASLAD